jgi:hypothetical protein
MVCGAAELSAVVKRICDHGDVADVRDKSVAEGSAETSVILGFVWWIPVVSIAGAVWGTRAFCGSEPHTRARKLAVLGCLLAGLGIAWTALFVLWLSLGSVY